MQNDPEIINDGSEIETETTESGDEGIVKLDKLRNRLKVCETEKSEYLLGWQRERADFANWKKEAAERKQAEQKYIATRVIEDLMPVLDSMNKARSWAPDLGFIETQMEQVLGVYGLERYGKEGELFDPRLHESVENVATDAENKDNTVAAIISPGYRIDDRVIRAAKVKVAMFNK